MYELQSQRDPKWSHKNIGSSLARIGKYGCLITSLSMLYSKFHPLKAPFTPDKAAKEWKFNTVGELFWSTLFKGMKFVWSSHTPPNHQKRTIYAESDSYGLVLELNYGKHFVLLHENTIRLLPWVLVADPYVGKIVKIWKWRITGYRLIQKV